MDDCYTLDLIQFHKKIKINGQTTILEAVNASGISIYAPCGGQGSCGKCKVRVLGKVSYVTEQEKKHLTASEINQGIRLACKTYLEGDGELYLVEDELKNDTKGKMGAYTYKKYPLNSGVTKKNIKLSLLKSEKEEAIIDSLKKHLDCAEIPLEIIRQISYNLDQQEEASCTMFKKQLIAVDYDKNENIYGIGIDIGTTTMACYLLDLNKGTFKKAASIQNPQVGYGADVISRIDFSLANEQGIDTLKERLLAGVNELISKVALQANVEVNHIYKCVIVGNTTMIHSLLGLSLKTLSALPFKGVIKDMVRKNAAFLGIKQMNPQGQVILMPGIAGFVGGDTVGAMIAADFKNAENNRLLLDLGTNGEIVLSTPKGRYTCSTAAGPAFEGAKIKDGMQAFSGAINTVKIQDDLFYTTIDNKPAKGICGSGLIDVVSELLKAGVINTDGRIKDSSQIANEKLAQRIKIKDRKKEVIIAYAQDTYHQEDITLTQKDIRELQLAKGAIKAGINILLKEASIVSQDIDEILLAGAFGNFVSKKSAASIGLFPQIKLDKIRSIGNGAGEGALMALCDENILEKEAREYAYHTKHIEISKHPDFQEEFLQGMYLN